MFGISGYFPVGHLTMYVFFVSMKNFSRSL